MKDKDKVVEYKTGLPLDQDIQDTQGHLQDQQAKMGDAGFNKKTSKSTEVKIGLKDKAKLQTSYDVRSDPYYENDDDYDGQQPLKLNEEQ